MMTRVSVVCFLMGVMASSVASAGEVKECWLEENAHNGTHCKVVLVEDDHIANLDASPVPHPRPRCERVKLFVDCDCDFKLSDRHATQFDKYDDEFNVGSEHDKLAVLEIKNEARISSDDRHHRQKAVLTISSKNDHGTFARRLVGVCKKKD